MAEQAQAATNGGPRPIVPFLKLDPKPHLVGIKCGACGAIFLDPKRVACSKCGATGKFQSVDLSQKGKVYVFSVVHQSFPGIKTPYVTAIVDLPEGVSVRANLVDVVPEQLQKEPNIISICRSRWLPMWSRKIAKAMTSYPSRFGRASRRRIIAGRRINRRTNYTTDSGCVPGRQEDSR